jgi:hypothetical protein
VKKSGYKRKTKGSANAPYGYRKDGKPKGKPGRKAGPPKQPQPPKRKPKHLRKKPGPKPKPPRKKNPAERRGAHSHKNRGGFKKDGTPMPPTHDAFGKISKEGAQMMGKLGGRPKGSFSMDRIIREELQKLYGKQGAETKARILIRKLVDQGIKSAMKRGTISRYLNERIDGKAVQPIKDVTPGLRLSHLDDAQLAELLAKKGGKPEPSAIPDRNKPQPEPSPSPTEGRSTESSGSEDAPPPPKKQKPKKKPKKEKGQSGLST